MRRLLSFIAFIFLVMVAAPLQAGETVRIAIGDWAPYTSPTDPKAKFLEKVVIEAFKLEKLEVKYEYFPWKRSYETVRAGEYDATFPWNKTPERENDFIINKISLVRDEDVYFHLKSKPFNWNTIDDLKKYKVGVTIGYKQEQIYKDHGIQAEAVKSEDVNLKKVLSGRIDVYQTSKVVGYATIKQLFTPEEARQFTTHPKVAGINDYYILFSKKTPNGRALADKFDAGMAKLKKTGVYDKIVSEYLGSSL